ncbi:MAG: CRTAC1 family protein [Bradymonadaceae bacterium]
MIDGNRAALLLTAGLLVGACGSGGSSPTSIGGDCPRNMVRDTDEGRCTCGETICAPGTTCDRGSFTCRVDDRSSCRSGERWSPGETAFVDVSSEWGIPQTVDPRGVRLSVADIDGDGWPDLIARRGGSKPNDFSEDGKRRVWLLRNQKGEGFEDVTRKSGLLKSRVSGDPDIGRPAVVVTWADVDNDGDVDAYTGFNKKNPKGELENSAEIMLNQGDGTFELGPMDNPVRHADRVDMPSGASFVDYNRDGNVDLWISQYEGKGSPAKQDRLYRGRGDGTFVEVTGEVGLNTKSWAGAVGLNLEALNQGRAHSRAWGSNACDLNDDGRPELLANSYGRAPNHLFRATRSGGDVAYENVSVSSGYAYDDRTDWSDNESARCWCKHNPDDAGCGDVPDPKYIPCASESDAFRWNNRIGREPFRLGGNTGTTVCADVDTDGRLDLLNAEIVHWDVGSSSDPSEVLYNRTDGGTIQFVRPGNEATGLTRKHDRLNWHDGDITAAVFDFDNDGRPDVLIGSTDYPGTRAHLWHQTADGTFEKVGLEPGIDHESSHGIALADFDRDGDVDVVLGHNRFRCDQGDHCYPPEKSHIRLFENRVGERNNWVQFHLVGGEGSNRSAVGARVEVKTPSGVRASEVDGGHGHYGMQHAKTLEFGLGGRCRANVEVTWPDRQGTTQRFTVPANARYRFEQGKSPEPVERP